MTDRDILLTLAEQSMGWAVLPQDEFGDCRAAVSGGSKIVIWTEDRDWALGEVHWRPLDLIADAWMVVESLAKAKKAYLTLRQVPANECAWEAQFALRTSGRALRPAGSAVRAGSAARAICLAAIRFLKGLD